MISRQNFEEERTNASRSEKEKIKKGFGKARSVSRPPTQEEDQKTFYVKKWDSREKAQKPGNTSFHTSKKRAGE